MLRGDIATLADKLHCSKTTVYNLSEKAGVNLHPVYGRRNKTVDILSGKTLEQERDDWIEQAINLITEFKANRAKEKADKRKSAK
jgi:hypothetical protein